MIEYVTIRGDNRAMIGIIDNFQSVIWESVYFGVGTFEIYAPATKYNQSILKVGNYVTRQERPRDVGIIEALQINFDITGALMITATGRFAKSLLDRRIIYDAIAVPNYNDLYKLKPVVMSGKVEVACRNLITQTFINPADTARKIDYIKLGALQNLPATIARESDSSQTTYGNLLEITDGLLKDVNYSSYLSLDENNNFCYNVYSGANLSETIRFSQELDNLIKSNFAKNNQALKTFAMCGGSGEGAARFYAAYNPANKTGIDRRELFVDGSSISREYTQDGSDTPAYYPMSQYKAMLQTFAQTELNKNHVAIETYNGEIDITANGYTLGIDYNVGDVVLLQDNVLNHIEPQRIYKATEVQDEKGYNVSISFDNQ